MLPCLDLIDPLMEFTRACARLPAGSPKLKRVDGEEQKVRDVVERLKERFENPPVAEKIKVVFDEFDEAEVVDSSEEGTDSEEDTEEEVVQLVKPKKKEKLNVYSGAGEQVEKQVETDVEKEVEKEVNQGGNGATWKTAKKHKKRQTEVDKLGPIQEVLKPRRSRLGDTSESLNRAGDSADEAGVENEDASKHDIAGARLGSS
ncbi:hypothetical protein N0V86_000100 [Didymella sp. IMI 355093]|nr:hypothetical protein N0V86_000100 [Didymella sp. IMI 355093]